MTGHALHCAACGRPYDPTTGLECACRECDRCGRATHPGPLCSVCEEDRNAAECAHADALADLDDAGEHPTRTLVEAEAAARAALERTRAGR